MRLQCLRTGVILLAAVGMLFAQPQPARHGAPDGGPPPPGRDRGPGMPPGKWWDNPDMVRRLGLTADQTKKLDDIFQQSRLKLIDLHAALEKEEAILDPLMDAPQPDDSKMLPEIDKIAQARAELEKANARLLLAIRHVLTPEQWQMLEKQAPRPRRDMPPPPPGGPDGGGPPRRPQR
jgi:protein CpxP